MKRIIDGKSYNTDTAHCVIGLDCRANRGDFAWHDTNLYQSPKGQFFIAGTGNAASMWAEPAAGGGSTGGDGIRLVDADEARQIMEREGCDEAAFERAGLPVAEG
jgi:hypothetical protein